MGAIGITDESGRAWQAVVMKKQPKLFGRESIGRAEVDQALEAIHLMYEDIQARVQRVALFGTPAA